MVNATRRPLPGRVWGVLAAMVLVALLCLMLALVLGSRLRALGPERGGGREGYMQVTRPTDAEAAEPAVATREEDAQLAALMDGQGAFVAGDFSGTAPVGDGGIVANVSGSMTASASVPVDMPEVEMMLPTEVPPVAKEVAQPLPQAEVAPLEVQPGPAMPRWRSNAVPVPAVAGAPMLALVIDDMGGQMELSTQAVEILPAGVTLSFFPWSAPGVTLAERARDEGHEIMIHMPMEPQAHGGVVPDSGPDTLRVGMPPATIETLLQRNVRRLEDIAVGVNNHMGSRFTEWEPGMRAVLTVLQGNGMLFVDSKTAAPTAVKDASRGLSLPVLSRDVFLDHVPTREAVRAELNKAVLLARKRGSALAIGHPLPVTLEVLREELPRIVSSGVVLVPVSMLVNP